MLFFFFNLVLKFISKWDSLYEAGNVVENVLKDNEQIYKALNPVLDFTLHKGASCFIAEIRIYGVDPAPGDIEIYVSDSLDRWEFLMTHTSSKDMSRRISVKEEVYSKYLRIKCIDNLRGGNLCAIRYVQVFGLPTHLIGDY